MEDVVFFVVSNYYLTLPVLGLIAAAGHVYQMVAANNFAPGNAGIVFYLDIAVPLIGFALLWLQHRLGREASSQEIAARSRRDTLALEG